MRVRFPPTQLIRISVLKTEYGEVAELADAICIVKTYHFRGTDSKTHTKEQIQCRFKSYPLHSRRWRKCPYKSRRCANYMSEVAQLVEHERKLDHVCDPNSNLSFHAKDVVGGSSPSLTLYGDVV